MHRMQHWQDLKCHWFIRRELARTVNLRNTPEIHFVLDQSIEYGVNMSKLIDDVVRSDEGKEHEGEEDNE